MFWRLGQSNNIFFFFFWSSPFVLATWFIGDFSKIIYYHVTDAPDQFVACGIFQLLVDFVIFYEIYLYSNGFVRWLGFNNSNNDNNNGKDSYYENALPLTSSPHPIK